VFEIATPLARQNTWKFASLATNSFYESRAQYRSNLDHRGSPSVGDGFAWLLFLASFAGAVSGWIASEWLVALVLTFATAFITLCIRLFVRRVQVIFDRPNNTITFRARNMRGYSEIVHMLSDLSHAKKEGHDTARCVLVFDKGMSQGDHPITQYSTSGPAPKQITDAINAWLKPPAPVDSEPPKA
jgi:hypothetical protein